MSFMSLYYRLLKKSNRTKICATSLTCSTRLPSKVLMARTIVLPTLSEKKKMLLHWQISMGHGSLVCLKFMVVCIWQENHWFVKRKNYRWLSQGLTLNQLVPTSHSTYQYVLIFVLYFKFAGKINLVAAIYPSKHWKS